MCCGRANVSLFHFRIIENQFDFPASICIFFFNLNVKKPLSTDMSQHVQAGGAQTSPTLACTNIYHCLNPIFSSYICSIVSLSKKGPCLDNFCPVWPIFGLDNSKFPDLCLVLKIVLSFMVSTSLNLSLRIGLKLRASVLTFKTTLPYHETIETKVSVSILNEKPEVPKSWSR